MSERPPSKKARLQPGEGWSQRETHYDAQANDPNKSRHEVLAKRKAGALYKYKFFANAVKRRMYNMYCRRAAAIVELGCGRGGDIQKWKEAEVGRVVALDLSSAQLEEARRRDSSSHIEWLHMSMLQPELAAALRPRLPGHGADAVVSQFALHYAFESEASASALLRQVASLLRRGGIFFGTAPDSEAILQAIRKDGDGRTLRRDGLLLQLKEDGPDAWVNADSSDFGQQVIFSLDDTVTAGSEHDDCTEFLLNPCVLCRLAADYCLEPIELRHLQNALSVPAAAAKQLNDADRYVAGLYFTFAFRKF